MSNLLWNKKMNRETISEKVSSALYVIKSVKKTSGSFFNKSMLWLV